jgi:hypothetical protein
MRLWQTAGCVPVTRVAAISSAMFRSFHCWSVNDPLRAMFRRRDAKNDDWSE